MIPNSSVLLCLLGRCSKRTVDNSVVKDFDINRLPGSWYEIAHFDHRFERGMEQTKATYSFRKDGKVDVVNTGIKHGKPYETKGIAKLTDSPGLLRVLFRLSYLTH